MVKAECEKAIRHLCHQWRKAAGLDGTPTSQLSFSSFLSWVQQNYASYLAFRTSTSAEYDVEMWFDDEFKQNWTR
ncbi:MAG TPA: hypothetical protein V6C72_11060 [Chroococcales cyanobacterium]|jgi:hypothetical protein